MTLPVTMEAVAEGSQPSQKKMISLLKTSEVYSLECVRKSVHHLGYGEVHI